MEKDRQTAVHRKTYDTKKKKDKEEEEQNTNKQTLVNHRRQLEGRTDNNSKKIKNKKPKLGTQKTQTNIGDLLDSN